MLAHRVVESNTNAPLNSVEIHGTQKPNAVEIVFIFRMFSVFLAYWAPRSSDMAPHGELGCNSIPLRAITVRS
jgi:hypothetical protein